MTRILFALLFVTTVAITTLSQTPNQPEVAPTCYLPFSQAPVIRGIRLGMKPNEWLKLFPGSDQDEKLKAMFELPEYTNYGLQIISFYPTHSKYQNNYLSGEKFQGLENVQLTLFDHQIIGFSVHYSPYLKEGKPFRVWTNISQLVPIFSETYELPEISAWK